jgi:hypothetical protein
MNPEVPDPLDALLADWRVESSAPSGFQREVWQRIAADIRDLPWTERLLSWWLAPSRLAVSALVAMALGGLLGYFDADSRNHQARENYFSSINPMDQKHHNIHQFANR